LIWLLHKIIINIYVVSMHLSQVLVMYTTFHYHPFNLYMAGDDLHMLEQIYRCNIRLNDTA
jgi:hypothetical protein